MRAAAQITDRAKRYRAQKAVPPQPGRTRCLYCGNPEPRDVDHVNGDESDGAPENLAQCCHSCNTTKGHAFVRAGIGVRTRQYNPSRSSGAGTLAEWLEAVMALKGHSTRFSVSQGIDIVRATPASRRSTFARQIWDLRRARGTDKGAVPF